MNTESSFDVSDERTEKKRENVSLFWKIRGLFGFFTVEPYLILYILPNIISNIAVQKLNMEKACRADLHYEEDICIRIVNAENITDNVTIAALDGAQRLVADMTSWRQPLQSGVPAIFIMFFGAWSDRTGNRKILLLLPMVGEMISSIGLLFATYFFLEWPLWATAVIESLPTALSGGFSVALMGSYSYLADITTIESRTFRIGVVAVLVTLSIPFGSAISGVLTSAIGYYGIFGFCSASYIIGVAYTFFRIKDVRKVESKGTVKQKFIDFFHPRNVLDTLSLIYLSRGKRLTQIFLVLFAYVVIMGPVYGESSVTYLYTLKKFSMDLVEYSLFSTCSTIISLTGTAIAVSVFSKAMKLPDPFLGIIATACKVVSSFVYGLAPTKIWFYSGTIFDIFGSSGTTAIRSLGTKIVEVNEVGKMGSLIALVEAIVPVIYTPIYSSVYSQTLDVTPGAYYILGGVMTIPAFFIFIYMYVLQRKEQRDVVKNPDEKQKYAHDNAITEL